MVSNADFHPGGELITRIRQSIVRLASLAGQFICRSRLSSRTTIVVLLTVILSVGVNAVGRAQTATNCDYFASPSGTGSGSQSSPFKIADFWSVASPGKTLCLLDGQYRGSDSMITPPPGVLDGSSGKPITVKALNDGGASIDGQGQREPVFLYGNDYFVLEGFNAHSGNVQHNGDSVVFIKGSSHNIVRRVVGWDAGDGNGGVFALSNSTIYGQSIDNLFEDVAGFGIARKVFSSFRSDNTICRRCWGRWEGSHRLGPKHTYTLAYNNFNFLIENSIAAWSGERMQETYQLKCHPVIVNSKCGKTYTNYEVDQPLGIFGVDRIDSGADANSRILGSLAYVTGSDRFAAAQLFFVSGLSGVKYNNNVAYVEPGTYSNKFTFGLYSSSSRQNLFADNLSSIGGAGSNVSKEWQTSNISEGSSVTAVGSVYNGQQGSSICKRYKDGILTDELLWPWPMDQRIYNAMIEAGRTPFYVTEKIEAMFGPIPSECRQGSGGSGGTGAPLPPQNLRIQ